jgi:hypothetical protein
MTILNPEDFQIVMNCINNNPTKKMALKVMKIKYPNIYRIVADGYETYLKMYLTMKVNEMKYDFEKEKRTNEMKTLIKDENEYLLYLKYMEDNIIEMERKINEIKNN